MWGAVGLYAPISWRWCVKIKHKKLIFDKLEIIETRIKRFSGILDGIDASGQDAGDGDDILALFLTKEVIKLIEDED